MKYLMLIVDDPDAPAPTSPAELDAEPWVEEMTRRGIRQTGDRVRPASDATTIRVRDSEVLVSDGPYAETREQMAGFDVVECADLDEAIEVAAKHPMARFGTIEVRPFWTQ